MPRHPNILASRKTALLIIDMQEKFAPAIPDYDTIEGRIITMAKAFNVLDLPIFCTEQYPKGLGRTTKALKKNISDRPVIEKLRFSAAGEPELTNALLERGIGHIVLAGIETHVCILQSALDFTGMGYDVHVVRDATASRRSSDRDVALERLKQNGVTVSCVESVLFELIVLSGTDQFKQISKLIK